MEINSLSIKKAYTSEVHKLKNLPLRRITVHPQIKWHEIIETKYGIYLDFYYWLKAIEIDIFSNKKLLSERTINSSSWRILTVITKYKILSSLKDNKVKHFPSLNNQPVFVIEMNSNII